MTIPKTSPVLAQLDAVLRDLAAAQDAPAMTNLADDVMHVLREHDLAVPLDEEGEKRTHWQIESPEEVGRVLAQLGRLADRSAFAEAAAHVCPTPERRSDQFTEREWSEYVSGKDRITGHTRGCLLVVGEQQHDGWDPAKFGDLLVAGRQAIEDGLYPLLREAGTS